MTKNLEKIDVFWDLDLERILGGFWEGFGQPKTSIFALLGKFLGRLGKEKGKGKKGRKKEIGRVLDTLGALFRVSSSFFSIF